MRDTLFSKTAFPTKGFVRARSLLLLIATTAMVPISSSQIARSVTPTPVPATKMSDEPNFSNERPANVPGRMVDRTLRGDRLQMGFAQGSPLDRSRSYLAKMVALAVHRLDAIFVPSQFCIDIYNLGFITNQSFFQRDSQKIRLTDMRATTYRPAPQFRPAEMRSVRVDDAQPANIIRGNSIAKAISKNRLPLLEALGGFVLIFCLTKIIGNTGYRKSFKALKTQLQKTKVRHVGGRGGLVIATKTFRKHLDEILWSLRRNTDVHFTQRFMKQEDATSRVIRVNRESRNVIDNPISVISARYETNENEPAIQFATLCVVDRAHVTSLNPIADGSLPEPTGALSANRRQDDRLEQDYRQRLWHGNAGQSIEIGPTAMTDFAGHNLYTVQIASANVGQSDADIACAEIDSASRYCISNAIHTGANSLQLEGSDYKFAFHRGCRIADSAPRESKVKNDLEIERLTSASKFLTLIEQMGAMPYLANLDTCATPFYISGKFESMTGFTSDQWCGNASLRISQIHPDDRDEVLDEIRKAVAKSGTFSLDYRLLTREGTIRWIHDEARVVTNEEGIPQFVQGVVLDVSESKQAQQELERSHLELQKLIGALDALREKEQRRLAQEMHDDLGQLLAAMKIDLATLAQRLTPGQPQITEQVDNLNELVDAMVSSVRRIIADLPPKIMEDRGLVSAITLLATNFEKRHGIATKFEFPWPEPMLDEHISTPIYRIVQEALNNVAKHSRARCVTIQFRCNEDLVALEVKDDGKGITACEMKKRDSFGLISMRERVNALGGEMKIESNTGDGTAIRIAIPMRLSTFEA